MVKIPKYLGWTSCTLISSCHIKIFWPEIDIFDFDFKKKEILQKNWIFFPKTKKTKISKKRSFYFCPEIDISDFWMIWQDIIGVHLNSLFQLCFLWVFLVKWSKGREKSWIPWFLKIEFWIHRKYEDQFFIQKDWFEWKNFHFVLSYTV